MPHRLGFVDLNVIGTSRKVPAKAKEIGKSSAQPWLTTAILCQENDTEIRQHVLLHGAPKQQTSPAAPS